MLLKFGKFELKPEDGDQNSKDGDDKSESDYNNKSGRQ